MFRYFVWANGWQLILSFHWLKSSRRSYILSTLGHTVASGRLINFRRIRLVSGSFWYPYFIMFAFVLATPALYLFFNVFYIILSWFTLHGKCSASDTDVSDCSLSLYLRILYCSGGPWTMVELAIKLLRVPSLLWSPG